MTATAEEIAYVGDELELFAAATNWKTYWAAKVRPYLGNRILDVGAGIGATVQLLNVDPTKQWLALEPDPRLVARMREQALPANCEVRVGTLTSLAQSETFDTVLYIDVLEHIEDDRAEMARAAKHVRPGGCIVVLAPAHQMLFTPFDRAIGHFRRYGGASMRAVTPPGMRLERLLQLDSVGISASLANKLILKSVSPQPSQIAFWDRVMVPLSKLVDPLIGYSLGKTIIGIWRKD